MKHAVNHPLESEKARELLDKALVTYKEHYAEYDVQTDWKDSETAAIQANIGGRQVAGTIKVCQDCYELDLKLPFFFRAFSGRIKSSIDEQFGRWIESV